MTENPLPPTGRVRRTRRVPLYRTVVSLTVAVIVAAWLPFSVFYVTALNKPPQVAAVTGKVGQRVITTRTSGGQVVKTVGASGVRQTQVTTPVATRVS